MSLKWYYPHFIEKDAEAQNSSAYLPKVRIWIVVSSAQEKALSTMPRWGSAESQFLSSQKVWGLISVPPRNWPQLQAPEVCEDAWCTDAGIWCPSNAPVRLLGVVYRYEESGHLSPFLLFRESDHSLQGSGWQTALKKELMQDTSAPLLLKSWRERLAYHVFPKV